MDDLDQWEFVEFVSMNREELFLDTDITDLLGFGTEGANVAWCCVAPMGLV